MARRKPDPNDVDSFLPLPASAMHIIVALADGELHRFENHAILAIANKLGMGQAELDATRAAAKARLAA